MAHDADDDIWEAFQSGQATGFRGTPYYKSFGFEINPFEDHEDHDLFWSRLSGLKDLGKTIGQHYSVFRDEMANLQKVHILSVAPSGCGLTSNFLYFSELLSKRGISTSYVDLREIRFEEDNIESFRPRTVVELKSLFAKREADFKGSDILFLDNAACFTDLWSLLVEEFWSDIDIPLIVAGLSKNELFYLKHRVLQDDDDVARFFINFFHEKPFHLRSYNVSEIKSMLEYRIEKSGTPPDWLFPSGVLKKIANLSLGIPRLACLIGDVLLQILNTQGDSNHKDPLAVLSTAAEFSVFREALTLKDEIGETIASENTRYTILRQVLARAGASRMETGMCVTRKDYPSRNRELISSYGVQPTHLGSQLPSKISYHLTTLARAHLLSVIKEGKRRFYYSTEPYSGVIENLID